METNTNDSFSDRSEAVNAEDESLPETPQVGQPPRLDDDEASFNIPEPDSPDSSEDEEHSTKSTAASGENAQVETIGDDWEEMDTQDFDRYIEEVEAGHAPPQEENADDAPFGDWDVSRTINIVENEYIKQYASASGLRLLRPIAVKRAYEKGKELGLVRLFITNEMMKSMSLWTSQRLASSGAKKAVSITELNAAIGLELGMSLIQFNSIREYWEEGTFSGHPTFKDTMSRCRFEAIRASISLRYPAQYDHHDARKDPLWHSRVMLNYITQ